MRILLLVATFDELSQRLFDQLRRQHQLAIESSDHFPPRRFEEYKPELIINCDPQLAISATLRQHPHCFSLLSGIDHNLGQHALSQALLTKSTEFGVSLIQHRADGDKLLAEHRFALAPRSQQSIKLQQLNQAYGQLCQQLLTLLASGEPLPLLADIGSSHMASPISAQALKIDWDADGSQTIIDKLNAAGDEGIIDLLAGHSVHLYRAYPEYKLRHPKPQQLLGQRSGAVCVSTIDGALWFDKVKPVRTIDQRFTAVSATTAIASKLRRVFEFKVNEPLPLDSRDYSDIRFECRDDIGYLHFNFADGVMNSDQAQRLLAAFHHACEQPLKVIVLMGGDDHWGHGIDLGQIEADREPASESWRNANALNDISEAILTCEDKITIAALGRNASASGMMMALACDKVIARDSVILNPHYGNLGLFGADYWTFTLPKRVGTKMAEQLTDNGLPICATAAKNLGLIDEVLSSEDDAGYLQALHQYATGVRQQNLVLQLHNKWRNRRKEEELKPLAKYRAEELVQLRRNFADASPYHQLRRQQLFEPQPLPAQLDPFRLA
ncbi:enoyl-CoA hydratase-related protein [Ferrimonas senticii]|uniref:enoyl-CoA hydratase-related protein n=1 Tax=Ferrimonas senticii TaxID=394566 RepID=UPI000410E56A|nr:enoyl-CoA hydratase-related protein [Ferrimonas senticii]